jgi:alpha-beta hydrolase superfamily lysophospholipase
LNPLSFATFVPYMQQTKTNKFRYYLKWVLWVLLAQFVLANISASIYAYKFTHFYDGPPPPYEEKNVFEKTWKLFVGPNIYKNTYEPEPPFPFEKLSLTTSDGSVLDAWYSAVDSSKGCVIFLHGYTGNKTSVVTEASMFRAWGYSVLLFDFRGHGRSSGSVTSMGVKETKDAEKAFEYARSRGNKKIILYGVSMGAVVSLKTAFENNISPDAIIADMPFGALHNHLKSRARVIGFPTEPFASLVTLWIGAENGFNGFRHSVVRYAKGVHCPVLLQWGDRDQFVMPGEIKEVFNSLDTKNKKLVVYPGAGHDSFLRMDPDKWQSETQAFLNSF